MLAPAAKMRMRGPSASFSTGHQLHGRVAMYSQMAPPCMVMSESLAVHLECNCVSFSTGHQLHGRVAMYSQMAPPCRGGELN